MGECMLDSYGEDGFQSCEGFDDWSTFSSPGWEEPQQDDNSFSDWAGFQQNSKKEEELSTIPVTETRTFELPENVENGNKVNPQLIFHECLCVEAAKKEAVMMEIPTLSQMLQRETDIPSQSAAITSEAANFWCRLQSGSKTLRLSSPKPQLHSHEVLLKTLQLRHPDMSTASQSITLSDLELEEPEDHPGVLIQTKLMPISNCRNAPGFLYQISRQWLSQYTTKLLPYQNTKDPLQ
ncbi:uncharacterized protein si:dkey-229e3.2 [Myxocyprinus asiaticus]|uniref:uncharacterized protein si:dkey-229e3.2 n=1 Tax=Myxocyprinus asiaticus TaxID=70543 RepID=UPI002222F258|nr:uncharacterized protein si:dkey-229e3.2 [Myxocyprinus asiaticus]